MSRGSHKLLIGDCRESLRTLAAGSVHMCMCSPPYFRLRSYLDPSHPSKHLEMGSEETPEQFIDALVGVFREVRRVLRDDGVVFVNLGDSYATDGGSRGYGSMDGEVGRADAPVGNRRAPSGLQSGDKLNTPERFALAMQADGWCHRDTIIWAKASPMPSSQNGWRWEKCRVKVGESDRAAGGRHAEGTNGKPHGERNGKAFDSSAKWQPCPGCAKCIPHGGWILRKGKFRTTTAYEPVYMFSKGGDYFCDAEGVREQAVGGAPGNKSHKGADAYAAGDEKHRTKAGLASMVATETRLPRSVWKISAEPTKHKHFAAYPTELVRRCVFMATSKAGCCPECGSQYAPAVETTRVPTRPALNPKAWRADSADAISQRSEASPNRDPQRHIQKTLVHDYRPTCICNAGEPVPATVLDPFGGIGRTARVAVWSGRNAIICELNDEYVGYAKEEINTPWQPKADKKPKQKKRRPTPAQRVLFAD